MIMNLQTVCELAGGTPRASGGFTNPLGAASKMPCRTYGIPAAECAVGGRLREVEGSVCHGCYAFKGHYGHSNVQRAQRRRLDSITGPHWVDAMVYLIGRYSPNLFRWHDSGDLQSVDHLDRICEIARRLPDCAFWLPTRERRIVRDWIELNGPVPANLVVRLSMPMVGMSPSKRALESGGTFSGVHNGTGPAAGAWACPAPQQGNSCGDCRACWDRSVSFVSYHLH